MYIPSNPAPPPVAAVAKAPAATMPPTTIALGSTPAQQIFYVSSKWINILPVVRYMYRLN